MVGSFDLLGSDGAGGQSGSVRRGDCVNPRVLGDKGSTTFVVASSSSAVSRSTGPAPPADRYDRAEATPPGPLPTTMSEYEFMPGSYPDPGCVVRPTWPMLTRTPWCSPY